MNLIVACVDIKGFGWWIGWIDIKVYLDSFLGLMVLRFIVDNNNLGENENIKLSGNREMVKCFVWWKRVFLIPKLFQNGGSILNSFIRLRIAPQITEKVNLNYCHFWVRAKLWALYLTVRLLVIPQRLFAKASSLVPDEFYSFLMSEPYASSNNRNE